MPFYKKKLFKSKIKILHLPMKINKKKKIILSDIYFNL
jgi:hypothetical protein